VHIFLPRPGTVRLRGQLNSNGSFMNTLYEAASAVEAHMLQDLLKQEGISATVQGSYLQGAIGELPAAGLVRLLVEDEKYADARTVIQRWEATIVSDPTPPPPKRASSGFTSGFIGLLIGIAASYAFFRSPMTVDGIDHNRDGVLDERWTFSPSGAVVKSETDRNLDGKIDYIVHFDARGHIETAEGDDNFDGVFESRYRFSLGNLEYSEVDTDGDGYPDLKSYFKFGVLESVEHVSSLSGRVVRVETYRLGRLISAEVDTDNDGKLDTRYEYGKAGAVERTSKITSAAPR
jgi:hypothetical protein